MSERRRSAGFPLPLDRVAAPSRHSGDTLRPQRPLREAVRDSHSRVAPSGVGLDSAQVRGRMVQRLHALGLRHEGLLQALQDFLRCSANS